MNANKHQKFVETIRRGLELHECCTCGTLHRCEVDCGGAAIDQNPCQGSDECTKQLCSECPQFTCFACGLRSCMYHCTVYDGEKYCGVCMKEKKYDQDVEETGAGECETCGRVHTPPQCVAPVEPSVIQEVFPEECPF